MALLFQRLARNFMQHGYFPTDTETTRHVLAALQPAAHGRLRILDPCCGEGVALAACKHHLGAARTEAFGVEYEEARAWQAKERLDRCIHGDAQECVIGPRQFGLLWLNPPYGDLVADRAALTPRPQTGRARMEKLFYRLAAPWLAFGGVLVLIVPRYSLDRELTGWIARHFARVQVYPALETRFQQVVVLGVRRPSVDPREAAATRSRLRAVATTSPPAWPATATAAPYVVPAATSRETTFGATRLDPRQLADELRRYPGLWARFTLQFGHTGRGLRRPLRALSDWHLALALAAGQVSGVVRATDGRVFAIKGDTHKEKATRVDWETEPDGRLTEIRTLTDRFVPVIRALDLTPNRAEFGRVYVIR